MEVPPNDQVSDLAQIATPVTNIPEYLRNIQYTRRRVPDNEVQTSESSMDTRASDTTEVEHFRLVDTYVGNNSPANVIIFLFIRNTLRALPTAEILNGHPVEQNMDILTYVDRQRKVEKVIGTCPRCGASSVERVVVSSPSGRCLLLYAVIQQDPDIPTLFTYWKREGQRLLHYVRNEAKPEDELPRDLSNVHMLIWVVSDSA